MLYRFARSLRALQHPGSVSSDFSEITIGGATELQVGNLPQGGRGRVLSPGAGLGFDGLEKSRKASFCWGMRFGHLFSSLKKGFLGVHQATGVLKHSQIHSMVANIGPFVWNDFLIILWFFGRVCSMYRVHEFLTHTFRCPLRVICLCSLLNDLLDAQYLKQILRGLESAAGS